MAKKSLNYLPQLIIGLDSLNDDANYIHIDDIRENTDYYCPCCKGLIKPRAYKKDAEYQVQPHFYHESGGCSDETYIHYICKNWLFDTGCKFMIDGIEYEVASVETEKTLHTNFGDYRPDIIVTTAIGKVFYFEIKSTNKKTEHYIPKWDELGNDVVEVDTRYFINQKYKNDFPIFDLIYSDGECFIKTYTKSDYDEAIAKRKLEWKRQDKLNYKIQWERLDWFWCDLQDYKKKHKSQDDVLAAFSALDYSDKLWCYYSLKNKSCVDLKELFLQNINKDFTDMLNSFRNEKIKITLNHISPKVYEVIMRANFEYLDYDIHEISKVKVNVNKGNVLPLDIKSEIAYEIEVLKHFISNGELLIKRINELSDLEYVESIIPYSHWAATNYNFHELDFKIRYIGNVHSEDEKEFVGEERVRSDSIFEMHLEKAYKDFMSQAFSRLADEKFRHNLNENSKYQAVMSSLSSLCEGYDFSIKTFDSGRRIALKDGTDILCEYNITNEKLNAGFEEELEELFTSEINKQIKNKDTVDLLVNEINSCKNGLWKIEPTLLDHYSLRLYDGDKCVGQKSVLLKKEKEADLLTSNVLKSIILRSMRDLLDYAENYKGVRFLEVD